MYIAIPAKNILETIEFCSNFFDDFPNHYLVALQGGGKMSRIFV